MHNPARIAWTKDELELLREMNLEFNPSSNLTDDNLELLYDLAPEYLEFTDDGEPTARCMTAENIITKLSGAMGPRGLI